MMEDEMDADEEYLAAVVREEGDEFIVSSPLDLTPFENEYGFTVRDGWLRLDFCCDDTWYSEGLLIPLAAFRVWLERQSSAG